MDKILHYVSIFSPLIPTLVGILLFNRQSKSSKLMWLLVVLDFITQIITSFIVNKLYKYAIYNFTTFHEITLTAFIFYYQFSKKSVYSIYTLYGVYVLTFFFFIYTKGIHAPFFPELVCLCAIINVIWVCIYFYNLLQQEDHFRLETTPMFWFCLANLIFSPCTYFFYVFRLLLIGKAEGMYFWSLHDILNITFYIFIAIGLAQSYNNFKKT